MPRKITASKYVVVSPSIGDAGVCAAPSARSTMDEKYATDTPAETRRFIDPNLMNRFQTGMRLPLRQRARISLNELNEEFRSHPYRSRRAAHRRWNKPQL
jgi:hypothetical protein